MVKETQKIMHDESIAVTATTVRVPVYRSHSESINIETEKKITAQEARELFEKFPESSSWMIQPSKVPDAPVCLGSG